MVTIAAVAGVTLRMHQAAEEAPAGCACLLSVALDTLTPQQNAHAGGLSPNTQHHIDLSRDESKAQQPATFDNYNQRWQRRLAHHLSS